MDLDIVNNGGNELSLQRYEDGVLGIEIDGKEMYLTKQNEIDLATYFKNNVVLDDVKECLHPVNKVVSGDEGDFCTECQKYLGTNRL